MEDLETKLNTFLDKKPNSKETSEVNEEEGYEEICDLQTGECYTIKTKDGLIERVNKTMKTEDGKTLLYD